ncbi:hypothetical protein V8E54_011306 [Elaphomyces granulatus]
MGAAEMSAQEKSAREYKARLAAALGAKREVLEELWPLFMGSVKQFKNEIIGPEGTITKYMEELMKANPNIAPNDASTSGLTAHLKAEFSHTDFLQVFKYLKSFLDWEKTPKEGKAYCRALFLNLAIQAKKQIHKDAAAKARGDSASREHLIKFWDAFPVADHTSCRSDFINRIYPAEDLYNPQNNPNFFIGRSILCTVDIVDCQRILYGNTIILPATLQGPHQRSIPDLHFVEDIPVEIEYYNGNNDVFVLLVIAQVDAFWR